ncbi:MAG TPA: 16S rRNA (cytosine(1402)-N(4))-methyltransferase RsmH [Thermoanaerobaculia bacterium]|nr:16S rRNA (cytosine(1402)-N(4))-methyltransferase RsmH [Thermoanaerobaculia bacterium]
MSDEHVRHVPVLVEETLRFLQPERGGVYVDCTLGLGGHAAALLERGPEAVVLGIDRDPQALAGAAERLAPFGDRARFTAGNFHRFAEVVAGAFGGEAPPLAGVLADLGVSSLQIDTPGRGFSFRFDGPLDMRMGGSELTAEEIVNHYSEADLERIFREYGEERQARRVARAVVEARREAPITTTAELKAVIDRAKRVDERRRRHEGRVDPATRVFQALRIEVNQELAGLGDFLDQAVRLLETEGRLVVISYHSLEDRIAKHGLRHMARGEVDKVTGRPLAETRLIEVLTKKPVRPSEKEVSFNPRSRSARLRAARRL